MIVALPVNLSNHALVDRWLDRCADLGGIEGTELLVLAPGNTQFSTSISHWKLNRIRDRSTAQGYPQEQNGQFLQLAWFLYYRKSDESCLYCDAAFLPKSGWLAQIKAAYEAAGKPFLVEMVPGGAGEPSHPRSICVLPSNFISLAPDAVAEKRPRLHWTVRGAHEFVPKLTAESSIFSQVFEPNLATKEAKAAVPDPVTNSISMAAEVPEVTDKAPLVFSHKELCQIIENNVKTETARKKLMDFLRERRYHLSNFGAALKDLVNAE